MDLIRDKTSGDYFSKEFTDEGAFQKCCRRLIRMYVIFFSTSGGHDS